MKKKIMILSIIMLTACYKEEPFECGEVYDITQVIGRGGKVSTVYMLRNKDRTYAHYTTDTLKIGDKVCL